MRPDAKVTELDFTGRLFAVSAASLLAAAIARSPKSIFMRKI
jgi:hypothetical protein